MVEIPIPPADQHRAVQRVLDIADRYWKWSGVDKDNGPADPATMTEEQIDQEIAEILSLAVRLQQAPET